MKLRNIGKHFRLITKHKWNVFKLCIKAGQPWRGLVHDLSKYSPTEFWEGVKYFNGTHSPITDCKQENGYSKAWLHHKGRNPHHAEYWVDDYGPIQLPMIPYPYVVEMICDKLAAGMVYNGKKFTTQTELAYWEKERKIIRINSKVEAMITEVLTQIAQKDINAVLKQKNLKELYHKHCE